MAIKPPDFTSVIGSDAMQTYLNAQKRANEAFEERNNRLFDPIALAAAQGFLAPTKTGSFGESLGNVAASLGPAQSAEEKRTMEMAKMRLDMATQGLSTEIQQNQALMKQRLINEDLGPDSPYAKPPVAPQVAPQPAPPAPPAGALPSVGQPPAVTAPPAQAPVQAPLSMAQPAPVAPQTPAPQAPQQAPITQAPQQPTGTQLFPAQPEGLTAQEKLEYKRGLAAGKDPYEIRKDIMETRRKNILVNQAGTSAVNLITGQRHGFDPTPTDTYIYGYGSYKIPATYATMLGEAQQDPDKYAELAKMILFGPQPKPAQPAQPSAPNATPTGAAPAGAPAQRPTTAQAEIEEARKKELATGEAKNEVDRRKTLPDDIRRYDSLARSADSLYEIVDKNPKGFGTFDKAGLLPAIGTLVRDGIRANRVNVDMGGFEDAFRAANPRIKDSDINAVRLGAAEQANIELNYANMFLKGTGPITEGERAIVRRAGAGNVSMSPEVLKLRAQAVSKRASYERDDLNAYREFIVNNPNSTYLNYMNTPKYKSLYDDYDKDMRKIAGVTSTKQQRGKPDLKAAGANVDKQTD
jgi:hypothetical protein